MSYMWQDKDKAQESWAKVRQAGRDGWELVGTAPLIDHGGHGFGSFTVGVMLFFKRPAAQ